MTEEAPRRRDAHAGDDSPYAGVPGSDDAGRDYRTLTYEVDGRVARITFDRPEHGNAITADTPGDLAHADKPTVASIHGFCVAGGTDIELHCDQIVIAADAKIGYPPTRVWGIPSAGLWAHRLGDQRAKRLLLTGDCLSGREASEWGLAMEAPEPEDLEERTEVLVQGVPTSRMVSTVFDGISRHTREGYSFAARAAEVGFKQAVAERDAAPYDDVGPSTNKGWHPGKAQP